MALKVNFTKKADYDFDNILKYIQNEFGSSTAIRFKGLVIDLATLLESFPEIGSLELYNKNIRVFVIHRRLKVYYRIKSDHVIILRLFDTRQNQDIKL